MKFERKLSPRFLIYLKKYINTCKPPLEKDNFPVCVGGWGVFEMKGSLQNPSEEAETRRCLSATERKTK